MYYYSLGIDDLNENKGYFYVWDETLAFRRSQKIALCLVILNFVVIKKSVIKIS